MSIRNGYPYFGKRYLINTNPNKREIHDLTKETKNCQIDEIKNHHIVMKNLLQEVLDYIKENKDYNGCKWCMPEIDNG